MVEGAPYTAWNNQLVCPRVPPAPVYKGARGRPAGLGARQGEGGVLLLVGVGLPMGRAIGGPTLPLLNSFIYGGGGHPIDTQVDH